MHAIKKQPTHKQQGFATLKWLIALLVLLAIVAACVFFWSGAERPSLSDAAANQQPLSAADAPSIKAIPQSDLPPEGTRSLFDHIIANHGVLPYPFESLKDLITSQTHSEIIGITPSGTALSADDITAKQTLTNQALESVLIPNGRSLLKAQANFAEPRVIVAAKANATHSKFELGAMLNGRLFLGFVDGADEIEVISYNEQAGRFEYQLVKDYCQGCTPKIVYAKRALCTTCHSNQSAIFSQRPWEETNVQPAISSAILDAMDEAIDSATDQETMHYQGSKVVETISTAERIDNLTEVANNITTTQRLWIDGCGSGEHGKQCRQALLKLALKYAFNPGRFNTQAPEVQELQALQAKHWPKDGVILPSADIASRDPFSSRGHGGGLRGLINSLFGQNVTGTSASENTVEAFENLPPLPPELDPLSPKPHQAIYQADTLEGVYGVAQLFSRADIQHIKSLSNQQDDIFLAVNHSAVTQLLTAQPFKRVDIINGLRTALNQPVINSCCTSTAEMSPPLLDGEPPLTLTADSKLKPFADYCFACHRGNPSAKLNFMSGDSEAVVLEKIKATDKILDVLDYERYLGTDKANQLMPPIGSWQRIKMDTAREEGKQPEAAMSEVMPSLF